MMTSKPALARTKLAVAISGIALLAAGCGTASSGHPASSSPAPSPTSTPKSPSSQSSASSVSATSATSAAAHCAPAAQVQGPALDAIAFVSPQQGWVAGAGHILATTNGGHTWTQQYSGPGTIDQVDFIDAQHGWAVGTAGLLSTTNGGATWTAAQDPCGSIRSVHFVTPDVGYAVMGGSQLLTDAGLPAPAIGGRLMATTDGGQQWHSLAAAPPQAQTACFTSASSGYLGTPGKIWRTSDGGAHWTLMFAEPALAGTVHQGTPDTTVLECAGNTAAWALFLGSGAALGHSPYLAYATQNAHTMHPLFEESYIESAARPQVHAPDGPGSYPGPFSVISPDAAVFVGFDPAVGYGAAPMVMVTGTGMTRHGDVSGISQAYGAAFVSDTQGWVVGENMQTGAYSIEATANGGQTWTRQYQTR